VAEPWQLKKSIYNNPEKKMESYKLVSYYLQVFSKPANRKSCFLKEQKGNKTIQGWRQATAFLSPERSMPVGLMMFVSCPFYMLLKLRKLSSRYFTLKTWKH
jgi:hypothetical protein